MAPPTNLPAIRSIDPTQYKLPAAPVREVGLVSNALQIARDGGCIVLAPMTQISHIPHGYAVSLRVVLFDAAFSAAQREKKTNGTFYRTDDGTLALHRTALDQLAAAAGLSWVSEKCGRIDDGKVVGLWRYRMTARYRTFDGTVREVSREFELDLVDGSPASQKAGNGLRNARIYGASLCESKAANRVVRAALGIRAYTEEEAARPFVFPALVWIPPVGNAAIDEMIAASELGIVSQVFGPASGRRTVIDVAVPPEAVPPEAEMLLEDRDAIPMPDARAEADRLAARARVDRQPVADEDAPPFTSEERWQGTPYTLGDVVAYCDAKHWPDPRQASATDAAKLAGWLNGQNGKADIDGFLGVGG